MGAYVFGGLDVDGEDGVRARAVLVHGGFAYFPVAGALLHETLYLADALHDEAGQVLHKDALVRVFLELELGVHVLGEQVPDVLVVDLKIRTAHQEFYHVCVALVDEPEYVLESIRNDASLGGVVFVAHHSVGLATAGLPVGEDGAVVALDDRFHEGKGTLIVDLPLRGVPVVHRVVGEDLGYLTGVTGLRKNNLVGLAVALNAHLAT